MRTGWKCGWRKRWNGAAKPAALCCSAFLGACASTPDWMDHTALVLRPSHKQALLAYSFGGEVPREDIREDSRRNVAASIAAAVVVNDNPLPTIDTVDFKGGRFYIHTPRQK